jgi:hypothetical protein
MTSGNSSPVQCDSAGNHLVNLKTAIPPGGNTIGAVTQASGPWTVNMSQLFGAGAVTPVVSSATEATHVLKASAGNLFSVYATNSTSTGGFLVVINATSAPADGAITPLDCAFLPANGTAAISYNPGPPVAYSTGITAVLTSAATCFTKTTGTITGFIHGQTS